MPVRLEELPSSTAYFYEPSSRTHVYILGTFHVSQASTEDVRQCLRLLRPRVVCLELCLDRFLCMFDSSPSKTKEERGGSIMNKSIADLFISSVYAILQRAGMESGGEFVAAVQEAKALGCSVVLGDINATDTFDELSKLVSITEMFDIPSALRGIRGFASSFTPSAGGRVDFLQVFSDSRRILELVPFSAAIFLSSSILTTIAWYAESAAGVSQASHESVDDLIVSIPLIVIFALIPRIHPVLIESRDKFLLKSILECCSLRKQLPDTREQLRNNTVLAIVGLLHVNGMLRMASSETALDEASYHAVWLNDQVSGASRRPGASAHLQEQPDT
ncbi:hypothetical protein GUITHDRAFT_106481 [Guillardia theta CCMP2712]|uniref:TraB domain-containing protein n=1 Tax=Guillardia theta (strain CCMP2712) TaxID=905079 RepID=L1JIF4_GUITC|nr:hypothetical protein GUITHDRAFT_106481 [Guillardia theta CCMP2712]EKX47934.1 hypothetical protein GUITHDRAFT_106481 [Guillardia theta CCMP2712]|eukprot:XP_005834914.1 hypothetical protein GUITHDRAFT_106481 [Guillardia theta CCMP2712]